MSACDLYVSMSELCIDITEINGRNVSLPIGSIKICNEKLDQDADYRCEFHFIVLSIFFLEFPVGGGTFSLSAFLIKDNSIKAKTFKNWFQIQNRHSVSSTA